MVLIDVDDRVDIVGIEHDRHVEFERLTMGAVALHLDRK